MDISYEKSNLHFFNSHVRQINKFWTNITKYQELYLYEMSNYQKYEKYYKKLEIFYRKNPKENRNKLYTAQKKLNKIHNKLIQYKYNRDSYINKIKSMYYQITQTNWNRGAKKFNKSKKTFKKSTKRGQKSRKRLK